MSSRIASPGHKRITLTGVMAVSDDFERARLIIHDKLPNGKFDPTWRNLLQITGENLPYDLITEDPLPQRADGVRGTCWFVLPKLHKQHWLATAQLHRSQWVRIEATVRVYKFTKFGREFAGTALDLAMLEPVNSA